MNVITNGEPRRSYDGRFGSFSSSRKKHSSASTAEWTEQQSSFEDTRPLTAETQRAVVGQPSTMDNIKTGDIDQTSQYAWEQPQGMAAPPGKSSSVKQAPQPIFGTTPDARIAKNREALEKQQPVQSVNDFGGTSKDKFKPTPNDAALAAAAAATGATAGDVAAGSAATDTSSYNFPTPKAQTFASPLPEAGVFDLDAAGNSRIITGYDLDDRSVTAKLANRIAALGGPNKPLIDQQPATDADKDVSRAVSGQPQEGPLATTARESCEGQDTSNSPSKAGKVAGGAAIGAVGGATAGGIVNKCMQYLRGGEPVSSEEQDTLPAANKQPQQPDEGVQPGDTIPATRKRSSAASDEATTGVGAVGSKGPGMRDQMRRQSIPEATGVEPGEGIFAGGQTSGPPPGSCLRDEQSMKPQAATAAPTSSQKDQQDMPGQQQQKGDKYIQDTYVPPGSGKGGMAAAAGAGAGAATGGALGAATAAGSGPGARQNQMPTSAVPPNNNVYESGEHPQQLAPSTGPESGLIYDDDAVVRSSAASSPAFEGISKTGEIENGYDDGWNSREQGSNKAIRGSPVNHEETAPGAWPSDDQQQRGGVAGAAVGGGTALAMQDFDEVKQRSANEYASNKQQPGSWQQQAQQQAHPDTWEEAGMQQQQQQQQLQSVVPPASMEDVQSRQVGGDSTAATAGGAQGMDQSLPTSQDVHPAEQAPPAAGNKARGAAAYQQQPAQQDFHPGRGEQPRSPKSSLASLGAAAGVAGGIASGALGIATGKLFGQKKSSRDERQQQEDNKQQPQSRNRRSSASSAQRQAQTPRQRRSSQGAMYAAGTEGVGVAAIGPRGEKGLYGGDSQYQSRHRDSSLPKTRQSSVGKVDPAADTIHSSGSNKAATAAPPPSAPQHDTAAETAAPNTVSTQQQSTQEDYPTSLQGRQQHQQGIATQNHHASTLGQQQKQQIASDASNSNNNGVPEVLQGATGGVGGGAIGNLSHGEPSSKRRRSIKQFFGGDRSNRRSSSSWKDNFNKMFNRKSWNEHQQQQQLGQENMPDFRHQSPARGQQLL